LTSPQPLVSVDCPKRRLQPGRSPIHADGGERRLGLPEGAHGMGTRSREAAVGHQRFARDEAGVLAGEEEGDRGDVLRPPGLRSMPSIASGLPRWSSGVLMPPGQIALTRMRSGASSTATARVRLITAAFAAEYACGASPPLSPAIEAVLMNDPPSPCAFITRAPYFIPSITPRTRTAKV